MPEIQDYLSKAFLEQQGKTLEEVLENLASAKAEFTTKLEQANLYEPVATSKWTPAKIADHLNTANSFFAVCLERALKDKPPIVMPKGHVTQDGRAINPGQEPRANLSREDLQRNHEIAFEALTRYAKKLETPELQMKICVTQSFFGELSTLEVLQLCAWHTRHHAAQIPVPIK
jgi:predicted RNase H-like HicB family nuclease